MSEHSIQRTERCSAITLRRKAYTRCKHTTLRGKFCHQHEKALHQLRIKTNKSDELGLFTTKFIPEGALICRFTGDLVQDNAESNNPYAILVKKKPDVYLDASKTNESGEGRWAHHAKKDKDNNAAFHYDPSRQEGVLIATRDIEAQEEIFFEEYEMPRTNKVLKKKPTVKKPSIKKPSSKKPRVKKTFEEKKEKRDAKFEKTLTDELDVIFLLRSSPQMAKALGLKSPKSFTRLKRKDSWTENMWHEKLADEIKKRRKELVTYMNAPEAKVQKTIDDLVKKRNI